ncbi:TPA: ATP synthase F1 subunit gamma [Patescibacteria group bacterium]|jgi:F-type H+-transporting ATPase subunit gamma|nr:ATP synthase F1 subunit gamma [Patescibacteria group bacterium]
MPNTQEISRRIKSIKATRKITRAMQMVSSAKMRKSQNIAMASRRYAHLAWELINNISSSAREHPLLRNYPDAKKAGVILITTNKGLVGSFNSNLIKKALAEEKLEPELLTELVVVGRKGREVMKRLQKDIIAEFPKLDATIPVKDVYPMIQLLTDKFNTGEYKKIYVVYNHFVSMLVQEPKVKQLLPVIPKSEHQTLSIGSNIIFEPDQEKVLNHLLPRILESQLYQAILESDASEHSARMMMMKNATEAAGDLIDDLTLTYNQIRQNKITTELAEITAGRIALE